MKRSHTAIKTAHSYSESKPPAQTTTHTTAKSSLLTPHTLRLLKLVREGTAEHAAEAAVHLKEIAAENSTAPQLWDILGHLQEGLTSTTWKTRTQAADALQGVAQHLPLQDQCQFLQQRQTQTQQQQPLASSTTTGTNQHYWTLSDLATNGLDVILENGRPLLSTSKNKLETEDQELANLDRTSASTQDFVQRRIRLQRRILAQRLGLDKIGQAVGEDVLLPESITTEDYLDEQQPIIEPISNKRAKKPPATNNGNSLSVRALLVQQMQEQERTEGGRTHRNPQQLLATELVYRMFDPAWHIRHGALLGTLSLLRAWRKSLSSASSSSSSGTSFGCWPRDILARSLCVLGLDRFGDFSGAAVGTTGGGVVAPVRQVAGQLIAMLFFMAPRSEQTLALDILFKLCAYEEEWETRQGALGTLKFLLVVIRAQDEKTDKWHGEVEEKIGRLAMNYLSDSSDDVKSAAAQVLTEYVRGWNEIAPFVLEGSSSILNAVKVARSVSSCIVDLVEILAVLLQIDARAFVASLSATAAFATNIEDLSQTLLDLLDSDFDSVRASVLRSLASYVALFCPKERIEDATTVATVKMYGRFVKKLFRWYMEATDDFELSQRSTRNSIGVDQDHVWNQLALLSNQFLVRGFRQEMDALEVDLLCSFFWNDNARRRPRSDEMYLPVQAAEAFAELLAAKDENPSFGSLVAIGALLRSPWMYQCEAACVLYRFLCQKSPGFVQTPWLRESLTRLLQDSPPCIIVSQDEALWSTAQRQTFYDLCSLAFRRFIASPSDKDASAEKASQSIMEVWEDILWSRGIFAEKNMRKQVSTVTFRIEGTVGGAIVSCGLPTKVTPLVRALMTSLINEKTSKTRQTLTCCGVAQLLEQLGQNEKFVSAQRKVLDKVCDLASAESSVNSNEIASNAGSEVLTLVARNISSLPALKRLFPLWKRIEELRSTGPGQNSLEAIKLLNLLCIGLDKESPVIPKLINIFAPRLLLLACEVERGAISRASSNTITTMCAQRPRILLTQIIPDFVNLFNGTKTDSIRLSACRLLKDVIEVSSTDACPFVRVLLPMVMSLMTDRDQECSSLANSTFADLVRIAPLVKEKAAVPIHATCFDSRCENVIDHLIFGRPLPPCALSPQITAELKTAKIELRDYQMEGVAWLRFLQTVKLNGALCDSMGLGKTLQGLVAVALAHDDAIAESPEKLSSADPGPRSLVVCPSSVVGHWVREIERFFPSSSLLRPICYVGTLSERKSLRENELSLCNIVVTSYSVLRSDIDFLDTVEWCCCTLDEGHLLKNPRTATARASKRLRARHKTILTGTPVQNRVSEVWAAFDFLMPNFLGSSASFAKEFSRPITKGQLPGATAELVKDGMNKLKLLHQQVLPFILRRDKNEVLRELPPKNITVVRVPLSDLQKQLYTKFCETEGARRSIASLESAIGDESASVDQSRGSNVFKSLLFLRLLCTHPSLVLTEKNRKYEDREHWFALDASGKMIALAQILAEAGIYEDKIMAADSDPSLLYCDDDEITDTYNEIVSVHNDIVSPPNSENVSGAKMKCLIFSQFTRTLDLVEELLFKQKMPSLRYSRLDGSVPAEQRAEMAEQFNQDSSISVMLLTTRIGSLGLNLTGAEIVIILESDLNPFADLQAMDRAHRINQQKVVNVYRIIAQDSVDELILELQEKKIKMSESIVNTENSTMFQMGTERLLDIFTVKGEMESSSEELGDYDLDALMESYAEDYSSLTVKDFSKKF